LQNAVRFRSAARQPPRTKLSKASLLRIAIALAADMKRALARGFA